jgi:hypothetical protein
LSYRFDFLIGEAGLLDGFGRERRRLAGSFTMSL